MTKSNIFRTAHYYILGYENFPKTARVNLRHARENGYTDRAGAEKIIATSIGADPDFIVITDLTD